MRLEVIPAKAKSTDQRKVITIVRNKVKLEEQSAQKIVLEIPTATRSSRSCHRHPAFYIDFDAMRRGDKDYKSTTRDVKKLLQELQDEGVEGIVIDLRNNGGGSCRKPMSSPACLSNMAHRTNPPFLSPCLARRQAPEEPLLRGPPGGTHQPPERIRLGDFRRCYSGLPARHYRGRPLLW